MQELLSDSGPRPRDARHRRAGPARRGAARHAGGAPRVHRGGRRHPEAPPPQGEDAPQARGDAGQPDAPHRPRGRDPAAAEAARAAGRDRAARRRPSPRSCATRGRACSPTRSSSCAPRSTGFSRSESERKTERIVLQEQLDQDKLREGRLEQARSGDAVDDARRVELRARAGAGAPARRCTRSRTSGSRCSASRPSCPAWRRRSRQRMVDDARDEAERLAAGVAEAEEARRPGSRRDRDREGSRSTPSTRRSPRRAPSSRSTTSSSAGLAGARGRRRAPASPPPAASSLRAAAPRSRRPRRAASRRAPSSSRSRPQAAHEHRGRDGSLDAAYEAAEAHVQTPAGRGRDAARRAARRRARARRPRRPQPALSLAVDQKDGSGALVGAKLKGIRGLVAEHVQVEPATRRRSPRRSARSPTPCSPTTATPRSTRSRTRASRGLRPRRDRRRRCRGRRRARPGCPAGAESAADVVTAPDGVLGLLARVVVADDLEPRARRPCRRRSSDVTVVTRDGDVLTEHVLRGGSGARAVAARARRRAGCRAASGSSRSPPQIERTQVRARREARGCSTSRRSTRRRPLAGAAASSTRSSPRSSEALGRSRVRSRPRQAEGERLAAPSQALDRVRRARPTPRSNAPVARRDEHAATPRPSWMSRPATACSPSSRRPAPPRCSAHRARDRARARARRSARGPSAAAQLEAERAAAEEHARLAVLRQRQVAAANERARGAARRARHRRPLGVAGARRARRGRGRALEAERGARRAAPQRERAARAARRADRERARPRDAGLREELHLSTLLERAGEELGLDEDVLVAEYGPEVPVPDRRARGVEPSRRRRRDSARSRGRGRSAASIPTRSRPARSTAPSSSSASRRPSASSRSSAG